MGRRVEKGFSGSSILIVSLDSRLKVMIFFKKLLGKDVRWVCRKLDISRATFYRHKKKLDGEMVITKR